MNVLYLGYWPATDPLTAAVITPRLKILSSLNEVNQVVFCSFERGQSSIDIEGVPNVQYIKFHSHSKQNIFLTKYVDFTEWPDFIKNLVNEYKINLIIANSPLAGGAAFLVWRTTRVPFIVECFEPHADYMVESGVWSRWDPRFWILKYFEKMQKRHAWMLQTVTQNYKRKLLTEGVSVQKIFTMPNTFQPQIFRFNERARVVKRAELKFSEEALVGVYVGKFGGIYYEQEAFDLFAKTFNFFGSHFRMIILSQQDSKFILLNLASRGINPLHVFVGSALHSEVPNYLSAADFAFATIKPSPCRIYCCPVKNGEYWANGLPIFLEDGIGEDSEIIKNDGGGIIFEINNPIVGFRKLASLLRTERSQLANSISLIAYRYRGEELITERYKEIVKKYYESAFT